MYIHIFMLVIFVIIYVLSLNLLGRSSDSMLKVFKINLYTLTNILYVYLCTYVYYLQDLMLKVLYIWI